MQHDVLNKTWKHHPTKQQLYGHILCILQFIYRRWMWHGWCWEAGMNSWVKFSSGSTHMDIPVSTDQQRHIPQLCVDTGCQLEDLPGMMADRNWWQEKIKRICTSCMTWWWWEHTNTCISINSYVNFPLFTHHEHFYKSCLSYSLYFTPCRLWSSLGVFCCSSLSSGKFLAKLSIQSMIKDTIRRPEVGLACFLCLMAYQPSWMIKCQSHSCRRKALILFNL